MNKKNFSEPTQGDIKTARAVARGWLAAHKVSQNRERTDLEHEVAQLRAALAEEQAQRGDLDRRLKAREALLGNAMRRPEVRRPVSLAALNQQGLFLEGVFENGQRSVVLDLAGVPAFLLMGRVADVDGAKVQDRESLLSFRFWDEQGKELDAPKWLVSSDLFGAYRYVKPDGDGWFSQEVWLPNGAARIEIVAHDFRTHLKTSNPALRKDLKLSDLDIVSLGMLDHQLLTEADDSTPVAVKEGVLLLDEEGVRMGLCLPTAYKAIQFEIEAGVFDLPGATLRVELQARGADAPKVVQKDIVLEGDKTRFHMALDNDTPFSQAIIRLAAKTAGEPVLLLDRTVRRLGLYPNPDLFAALNKPSVAPDVLDGLAEDWSRRKKWHGVHEDLTCSETPLVLVKALSAGAEPQSIKVSFEPRDGVSYDKKGMVLSLFYFDAEGQALPVEDSEFIHSPAAGNFRYIATYDQARDFMARLPWPAEGQPKYMALCLQGWNTKTYRALSARPVLAPISRFAERIETDMMRPGREPGAHWHGIFAKTGSKYWTPLLPNSWRDGLGPEALQLDIRLGEDCDTSPWRDMANVFHSPDTRKLRAIIAEARKREIPVVLHLQKLDPAAALPLQLIKMVDRIVATQAQAIPIIRIVPRNIVKIA